MSVITESDCHKIIEHFTASSILAAGTKNVSLDYFNVYPLSDKTVGFLGNHLKLDINLKSNGDKREKSPDIIKAFVKSLPTSPDVRKYVEELNAFRKEVKNFERLLPSLQEMSKKYSHPWAPECYLSTNDLLVFEDLTEAGFRMIENSNLMDRRHLIVAAQTLGRFHGASVIFESLSSKSGNKNIIKTQYSDCVAENSFVDDPDNVRYHWYDKGIATLLKIVKLITKYTDEEVRFIETKIKSMKEEIKGYFKSSDNKINVICHGDLWVNNFMFRYDEINSPIECRLVDFQLTRYAPGALDLTSMLCLCADKATRTACKEMVIAAYEEEFIQQISTAGIPVPELKTAEDVKFFKPAALVEAILFEMITRLDEKEMELVSRDLEQFFYGDRSVVVLTAFNRDETYRKRLTELIVEFVDNHIMV